MGTTADKLNKLLQTKQEIKQAIIDKGVEVTDEDTFASYPEKISSIQGGSDEWFDIFTDGGTRGEYLFNGCHNLTELNLSNLDTSKMTNMEYMFGACGKLTSLDISNFDTGKVTSMDHMFYLCNNLTSLDLSSFDTSKVTIMNFMFYNCRNLTELDVSNLNTSAVTTMSSMFGGTTLTSLDCGNWDVSKCTGTTSMNMFGTSSSAANTALVNFIAPKNIGGPMNVSYCTSLSHDSLMSIINNLVATSTTKKLTLGSTNLAKLTDEEKAVATNKGWTLG